MRPDIGENIRKARKIKDLTQKELALRIKKSNGYLSDIENGKKLPSLELLYSISMHLSVCPNNLLSCYRKSCNSCVKNISNL